MGRFWKYLSFVACLLFWGGAVTGRFWKYVCFFVACLLLLLFWRASPWVVSGNIVVFSCFLCCFAVLEGVAMCRFWKYVVCCCFLLFFVVYWCFGTRRHGRFLETCLLVVVCVLFFCCVGGCRHGSFLEMCLLFCFWLLFVVFCCVGGVPSRTVPGNIFVFLLCVVDYCCFCCFGRYRHWSFLEIVLFLVFCCVCCFLLFWRVPSRDFWEYVCVVLLFVVLEGVAVGLLWK